MSKIPVWTWRDAVRKSEMSIGAKCLCHSISCYLNDAGGYAYPSVQDLIRDASCSNRSVARYVSEAKKAGFLKIKRMHNEKGHVYGTRYYPMFPKNVTLPVAEDKAKNTKATPPLDRPQSLSEHLSGLSEKCSRHNSQNNRQNNKTKDSAHRQADAPLVPSASGGQEALLAQCEEQPQAAVQRSGQEAQGAPAKAAAKGPSFSEFWTSYPRKKGKARAERLWRALGVQSRIAAIKALKPYLEGDTYLRARALAGCLPRTPRKRARTCSRLAIRACFPSRTNAGARHRRQAAR